MARKKPPPPPPPRDPSSSSSSEQDQEEEEDQEEEVQEEEEDQEEEEEAIDDEEENPKEEEEEEEVHAASSSSSSLPPPKQPNSATPPPKRTVVPTSSSEDQSDPEPSPDTQVKQPTSSSKSESASEQPLKTVNGASNLAVNGVDPSPEITAAATTAKRPKEQVASDDEEPAAKKQLFQRLWNEDDEIVILKGMLKYIENKGRDQLSDLTGLFNFIKGSIRVSCNRSQFLDKVRRLKRKYGNNAKRVATGKHPTFSKPQEETVYELSNQVWGGGPKAIGTSDEGTKDNGHVKESRGIGSRVMDALPIREVRLMENSNGGEEVRRGLLELCGNKTGLSEDVLRIGVNMMDVVKVAELEAKWKQLKMMEVELHLKRVELVKEQVKAILDAFTVDWCR